MLVRFEGQTLALEPGDTVLEAIERQGLKLPAFCRQGSCQACMVKATRGAVPAAAQKGLKDGLRRQSMFLACQCRPSEDLDIERCGSADSYSTRVERVEYLSEQVLRVFLAAPEGFRYEAGQFIQLERAGDGLTRAYSIASLPGEPLELHVALLPGGAMSHWLRTAAGEAVVVHGPFGECFYLPDEPERPLRLVGSGTGLAPLLGVARAAVAAGHRAPIRLYHGSLRLGGLYLWAELEAMAQKAPALHVVGSLLEGPGRDSEQARCSVRIQPLEEAAFAEAGRWDEERIYLCGHHELVRKLQKKFYLAGVSLAKIHADPFVAPGNRP